MKRIFLTFMGLFFWQACADTQEANFKSISVGVDHLVSEKSLVYNKVEYINKAGEKYSIINLKYYLSHFTLIENDRRISFTDIHFIDAFTAGNRLEFEVPEGFFPTVIEFNFGIPDQKNVDNALPTSQEHLSMVWPPTLGGGYHYMKLEGRFINAVDELQNYNTHTGRIMRDDINVSHTFKVQLAIPQGKNEFNLVMDVNQWYESPNTYSFNVFGTAIMANPNAQNALMENGQSLFKLTSYEN